MKVRIFVPRADDLLLARESGCSVTMLNVCFYSRQLRGGIGAPGICICWTSVILGRRSFRSSFLGGMIISSSTNSSITIAKYWIDINGMFGLATFLSFHSNCLGGGCTINVSQWTKRVLGMKHDERGAFARELEQSVCVLSLLCHFNDERASTRRFTSHGPLLWTTRFNNV